MHWLGIKEQLSEWKGRISALRNSCLWWEATYLARHGGGVVALGGAGLHSARCVLHFHWWMTSRGLNLDAGHVRAQTTLSSGNECCSKKKKKPHSVTHNTECLMRMNLIQLSMPSIPLPWPRAISGSSQFQRGYSTRLNNLLVWTPNWLLIPVSLQMFELDGTYLHPFTDFIKTRCIKWIRWTKRVWLNHGIKIGH